MKPPLTLSTLDVERLEALLAQMPPFPGKAELEQEIDRADMREPSQMPPDVVTMNSTVRFAVEGQAGDEAQTFELTLVYPNGVKPEGGTLSVLAPVGSALLGLKKGDAIAWAKPGGGQMQLRLLDVVYQPERAGELHR